MWKYTCFFPPAATTNIRVHLLTGNITHDPEPVIQNQSVITKFGQEGETPYSYINRHREKLTPTYRDMIVIVDRKINSW